VGGTAIRGSEERYGGRDGRGEEGGEGDDVERVQEVGCRGSGATAGCEAGQEECLEGPPRWKGGNRWEGERKEANSFLVDFSRARFWIQYTVACRLYVLVRRLERK